MKIPSGETGNANSVPAETSQSAAQPTPQALFFAAGSSALNPEGQRLLQALALRLKENRRLTVTLVGHSDDAGSTEFDIAMAQRRVEVTATALEKAGVLARQIRRISYGNESRKLAPPCTNESCRQSERRVDLLIDG